MRKMILMSTLLLMTCLIKAQILNVSPTLKKGNVVTYKSTTTVKASGMDVTVTETSKYTVTEQTKDGFVVDMISSDWKVDTDNKMGELLVAATELVNGINFKLVTDKSGKVKSIKNYDEVKAKMTESALFEFLFEKHGSSLLLLMALSLFLAISQGVSRG